MLLHACGSGFWRWNHLPAISHLNQVLAIKVHDDVRCSFEQSLSYQARRMSDVDCVECFCAESKVAKRSRASCFPHMPLYTWKWNLSYIASRQIEI